VGFCFQVPTELSTIKLRERNLQVQNHHLHLVFLTDTR